MYMYTCSFFATFFNFFILFLFFFTFLFSFYAYIVFEDFSFFVYQLLTHQQGKKPCVLRHGMMVGYVLVTASVLVLLIFLF